MPKYKIREMNFLMLLLCIAGCKKSNIDIVTPTATTTPIVSNFTAYSTAFTNNGTFPKLYTCDSTGFSPTVSWKDAPVETNAYAVTMHTVPPTGSNHVYICLYNIASSVTTIPEAVTGVGIWGTNTVNGQMNYTPPCSQGPGAKIYVITVYALSKQPTITVAANAVTMDILLSAMSTITLGTSTLTVTYTR